MSARQLRAILLLALLSVELVHSIVSAYATEQIQKSTGLTIDDIYANFQTTEVAADNVSGYFDVQPVFKGDFARSDAEFLLNFMGEHMDEILVFYTDQR